LPCTMNDGSKVVNFLINHCNFKPKNIESIQNITKEKVVEAFGRLFATARNLTKGELKSALFFIYYSGHGAIEYVHTMGVDVTGEFFKLEETVRQLAHNANTYVISLFDCCREFIPKSYEKKEPILGQLAIIFATTPKGQAQAALDQNGLSPVTEHFLNHMETVKEHHFPDCLVGWENAKLGVEIITSKVVSKVVLKNAPLTLTPIITPVSTVHHLLDLLLNLLEKEVVQQDSNLSQLLNKKVEFLIKLNEQEPLSPLDQEIYNWAVKLLDETGKVRNFVKKKLQEKAE